MKWNPNSNDVQVCLVEKGKPMRNENFSESESLDEPKMTNESSFKAVRIQQFGEVQGVKRRNLFVISSDICSSVRRATSFQLEEEVYWRDKN